MGWSLDYLWLNRWRNKRQRFRFGIFRCWKFVRFWGPVQFPLSGSENLLVMVEIRDFGLVEILFGVFWIGAGFIGLFF